MIHWLFLVTFWVGLPLAYASKPSDRTYYKLLRVPPNSNVETIRKKVRQLINDEFNSKRYGSLGLEAIRLQAIIKEVGDILLDPQLRQEYDSVGPTRLNVNLFEFAKFDFDIHFHPFLRHSISDNISSNNGMYYVDLKPLYSLREAHSSGNIAGFINALRKLQANRLACFIHYIPDPPIVLKESYKLHGSEVLLRLAPPKPKLELREFQSFLGSIINKYASYVRLEEGKYSVYDRIVNLYKYLDHPSFLIAYSEKLSVEVCYMLLRDKPFDRARTLLSDQHPIFRPIDSVIIGMSLLQIDEDDSESMQENAEDMRIDSF